MRYFILALSIALIINGCKNSSNPIASLINPALSVSQVSDSMQYTFAIPRAVFGIHDTLSASFTAFNQSAEPETLMISLVSVQWSLKNDSGRTLMGGPPLLFIPASRPFILNPHQSKEIFGLYQAITDTSGAPVIAGSYVLQGLFDSMTFTLDLSLQ
ncbi:MAG: hypothetical protein WAV76_02690 [Bacteroidota bacterium]